MKNRRHTLLLMLGLWVCLIPAASAHPTLLGMTFTHYKIDSNAICTNGRDSARVMAEGAIIPQYDLAGVRKTVQGDLKQMQLAGFGLIRTVLWFTQDKIIAPWGQLRVPLNSQDAQKIRQFGSDIKAAGFQRWMVVFVPGIRNSPICKLEAFGDCWDPQRTDANIRFVESVYKDLNSLTGPGFDIEYDLSGELCPSRYLPPSTNQNINKYITKLILSFREFAPDAPIHVSCGGFGDDRAKKILMLFKQAGVEPNAIDIHLYDVDEAIIEQKLLPAAALAKKHDLPLEIGEMEYENTRQATIIGELARRYKISFSELIQWPLIGFTKCQINVNPPFSTQVIKSDILH